MDIRPIRSDEDHRAALAEIEACWGAPEGSEAALRDREPGLATAGAEQAASLSPPSPQATHKRGRE
jgi:hypothetical protein